MENQGLKGRSANLKVFDEPPGIYPRAVGLLKYLRCKNIISHHVIAKCQNEVQREVREHVMNITRAIYWNLDEF